MEENEPALPYIASEDEFGFSELIITDSTPVTKKIIHLGTIKQAQDKHSRFVLLGEPGASKTTTLRRLALEAAINRRASPDRPLPLLLYLPQWREQKDPQEFIRSSWSKSGLPSYMDPISLLMSGDVFLYLDGLNELGSTGINKAEMLRAWFESDEAPFYAIITCRTRNYYLDSLDLALPVVQIEPMNENHIRRFANNYLKSKAQDFLKQIVPSKEKPDDDNLRLLRFAQNPYLLAALLIIFENSPDERLPVNSGMLFDRLAKALAKRENLRHTTGWLPFAEKYEFITTELSKLAHAMIEHDKGTEISLEFALNYVANIEVINAAHNASYIEIKDNYLNFKHQLIQEYFAGKWLLSYSLAQDGTFSLIFKNRIREKWRQAFITYCGLVDYSSQIVESLLDVQSKTLTDIFLATDCVISGVHVEDYVVDRLVLDLLGETKEFEANSFGDATAMFESFANQDESSRRVRWDDDEDDSEDDWDDEDDSEDDWDDEDDSEDDWDDEDDSEDDWDDKDDSEDDWDDEKLLEDRGVDWEGKYEQLYGDEKLWESERKQRLIEDQIEGDHRDFFFTRYSIMAPSVIERIVKIGLRAVPQLIKSFGAGPTYYLSIKSALEGIGNSCIDIVINLIKFGDEFDRRGAILALTDVFFTYHDLNSILIAALEDSDVEVRAIAIHAVDEMEISEAVPNLSILLNDTRTSDYTRTTISEDAEEALLSIGTPEALKIVAKWNNS
jgi:hypothetical protein